MEIALRLASWILYTLLKISTPIFWILNWIEPPKIPASNDPILTQSAAQLAEKIRNRQITSESVVKSFIKRIKQVNPLINAVVDERFDAALNEAKNCDKILETGELSVDEIAKNKPLFGVPFTVKESCGLKGMSFTGCSAVRYGTKASDDSFIVEKMKKAGAIALCVTNTPEMCSGFESTNLIYGTTKNPYDGRYSAGGSSGGEGALIGAGASLIGIGSDVAGSIRVPALFNGVFGHKPTPGIISIKGHYPMSTNPIFHKFLVLGPMTRYAEDLHLSMKIMTSECNENLMLDDKIDFSNLKIYVVPECGRGFGIIPTHKNIQNVLNRAADYLKKKGSKVSYPIIENLDEASEIALTEFFGMPDVPPILLKPKNSDDDVNSGLEFLKSLVGASQYSKSAIFMSIVRDLNGLIRISKASMYTKKGQRLKENLKKLLGNDGVLFCPTFTHSAPLIGQTVFLTTSAIYCMLCNCIGFPSTHVPMGLDDNGMPIGFQVIAAPNKDRLCLAVAIELEKGFGGWVPPSTS